MVHGDRRLHQLLEHPAGMQCGTEIAAAEFPPKYRRGAVMQAILAGFGLLCSIEARLAANVPPFPEHGVF